MVAASEWLLYYQNGAAKDRICMRMNCQEARGMFTVAPVLTWLTAS